MNVTLVYFTFGLNRLINFQLMVPAYFFDVGVIRLLVLVPLMYNDIVVLLQATFQDKPLIEQ